MLSKSTFAAALLAVAAALPAAAESHAAHGGHAVDNMPGVCAAYFKRAETCFAKARATDSVDATNTTVLKHSLYNASPKQRIEMCQYADKKFGTIAAKLKCE